MKQLSERERKIISSLRFTKHRKEHELFIAEGIKTIELLKDRYTVRWIVLSEQTSLSDIKIEEDKLRVTTQANMKKLSSLESRQEVVAVFEIPKAPTLPEHFDGLVIGLEELQNPGNLGTIIRLCDWLGIQHILCSKGCVDLYNPKVIQASMGAIGNITLYQDLDLAKVLPSRFHQIIATTMQGRPYQTLREPMHSTILLFGNEGNGLTQDLLDISTDQVTIPKSEHAISDSLNVSLSASILLSYCTSL